MTQSHMRRRSNIFGNFFTKDNTHKIEVLVELIEYEDKGIYYAYTPSLNILGYGKSAPEARNSWEIMMEEYFRYTTNKKTLSKDLESYGWTITKKQMNPPSFSWLLQNNEQVSEVYNKHDFNKSTRQVRMPLADACA